ncbi:hypothetical protein D3C78_1046900 [compost metagenome]
MAYGGGLRAQLDEVRKVTPGAKPVGLWLDIYRAGSLLNAWVNHFTLTLSVPALTDYVDDNGYQHHVTQVAAINSDDSVTDLRRKRTIELSGDVAGQGILEDAQGVNITVEVKDNSHRHQWDNLTQVPETANRWPIWDEISEKPDLAVSGHHHTAALGNADIVAGDWGQIGTYALLIVIDPDAPPTPIGNIYAGSQLKTTNLDGNSILGSQPPGSWKALCLLMGGSAIATTKAAGLFIRTA